MNNAPRNRQENIPSTSTAHAPPQQMLLMKAKLVLAVRLVCVGLRASGWRRPMGVLALTAGGLLTAHTAWAESPAAEAVTAPAGSWPVVGRQGVIQIVIVPVEQATNRAAYDREIASICTPGITCFVNFFSNSTGATVALPLPDAISAEATAIFRRSIKQGGEFFRWSCRLRQPEADCF